MLRGLKGLEPTEYSQPETTLMTMANKPIQFF